MSSSEGRGVSRGLRSMRYHIAVRTKINQEVSGNRKWFWKKVGEVNGGKEKDCKMVKDKNGILAMGWGYVREIWKEYFEDLYSLKTEEEEL